MGLGRQKEPPTLPKHEESRKFFKNILRTDFFTGIIVGFAF
jgi:hypothetical protein